uniref:Uncharacterized protein n=1 Tax=Amphimedon queenslandica TaxID=400682 RepID=A0A1X7SFP5_AMPQE
VSVTVRGGRKCLTWLERMVSSEVPQAISPVLELL